MEPYGAPWLQPVAIGGKRVWRRSRGNKRTTVAVACDRLQKKAHGKEGSPVRVRKRALQKRRTSALFGSGGLALRGRSGRNRTNRDPSLGVLAALVSVVGFGHGDVPELRPGEPGKAFGCAACVARRCRKRRVRARSARSSRFGSATWSARPPGPSSSIRRTASVTVPLPRARALRARALRRHRREIHR
jgi:hypothetical protein